MLNFVQGYEPDRTTTSRIPRFSWVAIENITSLEKCRNSVQGPQLIADELGTCL